MSITTTTQTTTPPNEVNINLDANNFPTAR
jgi:hypothetical protein